MTLDFSSGDNGDELADTGKVELTCRPRTPWVTAVGGTSLGIGNNGQRVQRPAGRRPRARSPHGAWGPAAYLYGSEAAPA